MHGQVRGMESPAVFSLCLFICRSTLHLFFYTQLKYKPRNTWQVVVKFYLTLSDKALDFSRSVDWEMCSVCHPVSSSNERVNQSNQWDLHFRTFLLRTFQQVYFIFGRSTSFRTLNVGYYWLVKRFSSISVYNSKCLPRDSGLCSLIFVFLTTLWGKLGWDNGLLSPLSIHCESGFETASWNPNILSYLLCCTVRISRAWRNQSLEFAVCKWKNKDQNGGMQ